MNRRSMVVVALVCVLALVGASGRFAWLRHERYKQIITETAVTSIAQALEAFHADHGRYPPRKGTADTLARFIDGYYGGVAPINDEWGNPLMYRSDGTHYVLWAVGSDGRTDPCWPGGGVAAPDGDIVFKDGRPWQFPAGSTEIPLHIDNRPQCGSCHRDDAERHR